MNSIARYFDKRDEPRGDEPPARAPLGYDWGIRPTRVPQVAACALARGVSDQGVGFEATSYPTHREIRRLRVARCEARIAKRSVWIWMQREPRHVLIIEDDRITALVLSEFLSAYGYRTSVASNGEDGVVRFLMERPDLALVDALLPRKNGFQACFEMKQSQHGKYTPVLMMSAVYNNTETAIERSHDVKAEAFLQKPFDLDVLLERVQQLVGDP